MEHLIIPDGYASPLTIRETEVAIKEITCKITAPYPCIRSIICHPEVRSQRQLKWCGTPCFFWYQRTGGRTCRDRTLSRQMETIRSETLRLPLRRGTLHRYERDPPG